jgi:NADPH2:quinone reductase
VKALLCKAWGPPSSLVVEEVADPVIAPGAAGEHDAIVRVHAAGVNFPDTLIIQNKYQFKPERPFSPGGECAGVVEALGPGAAKAAHVKPGDRVIAFASYGAFAERVRCDARALVPMPPDLDFVTASAFVMAYGTSYHALVDRAALAPGETLLVLGASGGVGLAAVEIGKALGARVIACASSADKLAVCRAHGADELVDYEREDLKERVKALTGGKGVDVVYDPVGGKYTEAALRATGWRGRLLVVGFAAGDIPQIPANLPLLKGASVVGVFWGDFAKREPGKLRGDLRQLLTWLAEGKLKPRIAEVYPLERGADALTALAERRVSGKLVIVPTQA